MRKPSETHKESHHAEDRRDTRPEASQAATPVNKAWPFAPGSQLGEQVVKPWVPKPTYRFNQR